MTEATSEDITGGCACGAIRYRCSAPPIYMGNCHCRDCQQATGGAYLPAVLFRGEHFTLEQGEHYDFVVPLAGLIPNAESYRLSYIVMLEDESQEFIRSNEFAIE